MPLGSTAVTPAGVREASPQLLTMLPSASYTITGGAGIDWVPSWASSAFLRNPLLTVMMWSCESMQLAPTSPVTHWCDKPLASLMLGSALGQNGSTLKAGIWRPPCAVVGGEFRAAPAMTSAISAPGRYARRNFMVLSHSSIVMPSG